MSQNLDATAINQIHALISAQGVNEIITATRTYLL